MLKIPLASLSRLLIALDRFFAGHFSPHCLRHAFQLDRLFFHFIANQVRHVVVSIHDRVPQRLVPIFWKLSIFETRFNCIDIAAFDCFIDF